MGRAAPDVYAAPAGGAASTFTVLQQLATEVPSHTYTLSVPEIFDQRSVFVPRKFGLIPRKQMNRAAPDVYAAPHLHCPPTTRHRGTLHTYTEIFPEIFDQRSVFILSKF